MRQIQKKTRKRTRAKPREPLAEGIVPLDKRGRRSWASMGDEQILEVAKGVIWERNITSKSKLETADKGLYKILLKRKLLGRIDFEEKKRPKGFFSQMSDDELVDYAKRLMKGNGIRERWELGKADGGLYGALRARRLLDEVGFQRHRRDRKHDGFYSSMNNEELVSYAKKFMHEMGITNRTELMEREKGLYKRLRERGLLKALPFDDGFTHWNSMSDKKFVDFVRWIMDGTGIKGRKELKNANQSMYEALRKRNLLDRVGFEEKRRRKRPWQEMSDDELVARAKGFIQEKGIIRMTDLHDADMGLYSALKRRGLRDSIGFEYKKRTYKGRKKGRKWASVSDEELIARAKELMKEKEITRRAELQKVDRGLYGVLWKRKLLDRVFEDIEQAREREEAQALFDGLMEFGGAE